MILKMTTNFDMTTFFNDFNTNCNKVYKKNYKKGEIITTYIEKRNQMCILLARYSKFN